MDFDAFDSYAGAPSAFADYGSKSISGQQMGKVAIESLMSKESVDLKHTIEQEQPRFLEQVHRFNASAHQSICVQRFPDNYVFSMV